MPNRENLALLQKVGALGAKVLHAGNLAFKHFNAMGEGAFDVARDLKEVGQRLIDWTGDALDPFRDRKAMSPEAEDLHEYLADLLREAQPLRAALASGGFEQGAALLIDVLDAVHTTLQIISKWGPSPAPEKAPEVRSWFSCRVALRSEPWYRTAL